MQCGTELVHEMENKIFISSSTHILSHSYMCLTFSTSFSAYYCRSCFAKVVFVLCSHLNRAFSVLFQVQLELSRPVVVVVSVQ